MTSIEYSRNKKTNIITRTMLAAVIVLVISAVAVAKNTEIWTWVSGSDVVDQHGVYGIKGVAGPNNLPGVRLRSVSWIDSSDNLWLFGGSGFDITGTYSILNDLWKFDGANWTWVSGSNIIDQVGVYGTKGMAASGNVPGARDGSISWTDSSGNLWLFGGANGWGPYNDLWKYNPSSGLWTWVSGSNKPKSTGVYGTKGVAAPGNVPGARFLSVSWTDSNDNLWLFGGLNLIGQFDDLWKYNLSSGYWTWVSGSTDLNQIGIYGTKGVAAPGNAPGARHSSVSWIDSNGNLWLFGGVRSGFDGRGIAVGYTFNDLWEYNPSSGLWTWVSGSNAENQFGVYGTKGVPDTNNMPGGRWGSNSWIDSNGNFWLFGGAGKASDDYSGVLNDLWKFDGANWTWVSGSNIIYQGGVYGTKGMAASGNVPGARGQSISWTDSSGNLWLFGGSGYGSLSYDSFDNSGFLNDLWKFGKNTSGLQFGNIPGAKNIKLTVNDANGIPVTFFLTGVGYGEVIGGADFDQVTLYGTNEKSQLTISTKGNTWTKVGSIICNGPMKSITAKTAELSGGITIGSSSNPKADVTIIFDQANDLAINSQMPIKSLTATDWLGGAINTSSIGSITIKGDAKRAISGDLVEVDINLSQIPDVKIPALGKLSVSGWIDSSQILSQGNIGTVTSGAMIDSNCFAGVAEGIAGLPAAETASFSETATIKSIAVKGIKTEPSPYYINSNIAAANIISVSIAYPQSDNGGVPFGLTADNIKKQTIKMDVETIDDFEIRLY
jgi:hypothetical protein